MIRCAAGPLTISIKGSVLLCLGISLFFARLCQLLAINSPPTPSTLIFLHRQPAKTSTLRPPSSSHAAIVTSTSTPASMLMMICLTTSVGAFKSISLLWILISNISHVLLPSPAGDLRVVILRILVGSRTGPLTRRFLDLARSRSSVQTFSSDCTFRDVSVMRILWIFCSDEHC